VYTNRILPPGPTDQPAFPADAFSDRKRMRPRRMLKREMEELSIRRLQDRNASPQRELVVRPAKGIIHINGADARREGAGVAEGGGAVYGRRGVAWWETACLDDAIVSAVLASLPRSAYFWLR